MTKPNLLNSILCVALSINLIMSPLPSYAGEQTSEAGTDNAYEELTKTYQRFMEFLEEKGIQINDQSADRLTARYPHLKEIDLQNLERQILPQIREELERIEIHGITEAAIREFARGSRACGLLETQTLFECLGYEISSFPFGKVSIHLEEKTLQLPAEIPSTFVVLLKIVKVTDTIPSMNQEAKGYLAANLLTVLMEVATEGTKPMYGSCSSPQALACVVIAALFAAAIVVIKLIVVDGITDPIQLLLGAVLGALYYGGLFLSDCMNGENLCAIFGYINE